MDIQYNPKKIEEKIYSEWEKENHFQPTNNIHKENYCIIMPPPNITGTLHLGHAFQHTIMDILIRYQRMQGKNTLWQPGMDHAGIATQILIENYISEHEDKTKHDYGEKKFIEKIWEWKSKNTNTIRYQMKRLGLSASWKQERFTMDEETSKAVQKVFIQLYEENIIYRGKRLINWDPKIQTALSDLEIEIKKVQSNMWYLRYPLSNNKKTIDNLNYITVGTTRPETLFGDVAIAIHPDDPRYQNLIGNFVHIPITHRKIPIITDTYVDKNKGTGCMKITPAHDFNDYEIAKKHKLPIINIFTTNGNIRHKQEIFDFNSNSKIDTTINFIPKNFQNINRFKARKIAIQECDNSKLLDKTEPYKINLLYSSRTGEPIEPMLTNQWYIRTHILSKKAIKSVECGQIQFIPEEYKKTYFNWMNNLQDWCISRQLWWGHKIPAWYDDNRKIYVGYNELDIRKKYKLNNKIQLYKDEDVLDTWFSSGLWTFTSLGWPQNTKTLNKFHPTNVMVSGFDIIFFWIARMIMLTMHFIKNKNNKSEIPFKKIYITGLILDETGKKMSKSQGNIIDPLDIIDGISSDELLKKRTTNMMQPKLSKKIILNTQKKFPNGIKAYGADSLRFTLTALASSGKNIHWDMQRLSGYHNFCNKLWHAGQFVLINVKEKKYEELHTQKKKILSDSDQWILTKLQKTINIFRQSLDNYRFDQAANILHTFIWSQFCNWYIEFSKTTIHHKNKLITYGTHYTLLTVLKTSIQLAHPIIPFITEAIWKKIKHLFKDQNSIMIQRFPDFDESLINTNSVINIEWIQKTIVSIRNIRANMNVTHHVPLTVIFQNASYQIQKRIKNNIYLFNKIINVNNIIFSKHEKQHPNAIVTFIENTKIIIPITTNNNRKNDELDQINKNIQKINKEIIYITKKINNKNFINHAPHDLITREKNKLNNLKKIKQELSKREKILFTLQKQHFLP